MTTQPEISSCEKCGTDVLTEDAVDVDGNLFCSQECSDEFDLEEAEEDAEA